MMPGCGRVVAKDLNAAGPPPGSTVAAGVLAQRHVGLSLQRGLELLVADRPVARRTAGPCQSLVGHVGPLLDLRNARPRSGSPPRRLGERLPLT